MVRNIVGDTVNAYLSFYPLAKANGNELIQWLKPTAMN